MKKAIAVVAAAFVAVCVATYASVGFAARNSSGTMVAANGPYVAGTVIDQTQVNARLADIENELTSSLDRSGRGAMLAPLQLSNGTVTAPSLTFGSETGTGLYRVGLNNPALSVAGTKRAEWNTTGELVTGTLGVSSDFAVNTNKFTVTAASGNVVEAGDLNINSGKFTVTAASGNTAVAGTLGVTGVATMSNQLFARGNAGLWSSNNIGTNLLVQPASSATNNPALGLSDSNQTNWLALINQSGVLQIATMPAPSDSVTAPTIRASVGPSGVTIGSSGTAISASQRLTGSCVIGTLAANSCQGCILSGTGLVSGADCATGFQSASAGVSASCAVTGTTSCAVTICNVTTGGVTLGTQNVSCRVFNP